MKNNQVNSITPISSFTNNKLLLPFIDSHTHMQYFNHKDKLLRSSSYNSWKDVWNKAQENGIYQALNIFELGEYENILHEMKKEQNLYVSVGTHPLEVKNINYEKMCTQLKRMVEFVHAIGETGIDLKKDTNMVDQIKYFIFHIEISLKYKKPLVIHCRGINLNILFDILKPYKNLIFVLHCCTYSWNEVKQMMDLPGCYVSLSGIVTYKNAQDVRTTALNCPLHRLLLETDSPFLVPDNIIKNNKKISRHKVNNETSYVRYVYEYICEIRKISLNTLSQSLKNNFKNFIFNEAPKVQ